jgi:hypothetical protein
VALWALFGREGTLVDPPIAEDSGSAPVPYRYLLTCPSIVAACCAGFVTYWGLALTLTWRRPPTCRRPPAEPQPQGCAGDRGRRDRRHDLCRDPDDRERAHVAEKRVTMLAIVNSVMTFAGVIAPLAMGAVVQNAATQAAGYERGYLISGGLLLVGGLIGLLCIRPERDRLELARHALPFPSLQPLRG